MIEELTSEGEGSWVDVSEPSPDELAEFIRESQLTQPDAAFVAHDHHRPEVIIRDSYLILLINVPVFDRQARVTRGYPLYLIITPSRLYTVHHEPMAALDKFWDSLVDNAEARQELLSAGGYGVAMELLKTINESSMRKLGRLQKHVSIAEEAVFHGNERKMVREISVLMRDVMDFRRIMRPHINLFAEVPQSPLLEKGHAQWRGLHSTTVKLWELLESLFESLRELRDTNANVLQQKENEILRVLTIYSIIVIPVIILIDPFFAPGAADATTVDRVAFAVVMVILVGTLLGVMIYARRKRLL